MPAPPKHGRKTFRVSEHDLRARPTFHWTPRRLQRRVELQQGDRVSPERVHHALTHVQHSVLEHKDTKAPLPRSTGRRLMAPADG